MAGPLALSAEARAAPAVGELADQREAVVVEAELGDAARGCGPAEATLAPVARGDPNDVATLGKRALLAAREEVGLRATGRDSPELDGANGLPAIGSKEVEPHVDGAVSRVDPE